MTSICTIPAGPSARPTKAPRWGRKERDDFFHSFSVYGAATFAQFVATTLVDRDLAGPADRLAAALRPTLQTRRRTTRLQRQLIHQLRHSGRGHHVGAVRGRLERNGRDYGHESRRDGPPAGLADQPRGDHYWQDPFDVRREHSSIAHPD